MTLLFCLLLILSAGELPNLTPEKPVTGRIETTDREVHTSTLDERNASTVTPTRGKRTRLEIKEPGIYSIELRAYLFDAYLVLRDGDDLAIAEDDDGLIGTHARIVRELAEGEVYWLDVCALREGSGAFELHLLPGEPKKLSRREQAEAELDDAKQAVAVLERELGSESRRLAASLDALGMLYYRRGAYPDCAEQWKRALAIREKVLGPEHPQLASSLNNQAMLLEEQGKPREAQLFYERALAMYEKLFGPEHVSVATSLNNLAGLMWSQAKYEEARPLYARALAMREKLLGPEHPSVASILNNLAALLTAQGEYERARPRYERALAIREKTLGPDHPDVASSLNNLGLLFWNQGKYEEARPLYERALAIYEEVLGPKHPRVAMSLNNLATLLTQIGKYEEARPLYERTLEIIEKVLGPKHPNVAMGLNNLALLLCNQGKHDEAKPLYERALAINEQVWGPEHGTVGKSLNNLAALLEEQGKYHEARPLKERSLAISEKVLGGEHPDVMQIQNDLILFDLDTLHRNEALSRGRQLLARGRSRLLEQIALSSESDALNYASLYKDNIQSFLSAATVDERVESYGAVVNWKGQVSRLFGQSKRRLLAKLDQRDKLDRLRSVQSSLSNLLSAKEIKNREEHAQNLERLRKERGRLGAELQQVAANKLQVKAVTLAQLGAALPERTVWVDFLEHTRYEPAQWKEGKLVTRGEWGSLQVTAWIVRPGGELIEVALGESETLRNAIEKFLGSVTNHRGLSVDDDSPETNPFREANERVRTLLWEPLAKQIGDARQVFVCPDVYLATLPFEILQDSDDKFLVEKYAFTYLRDGAALVELNEPQNSLNEAEPTFLASGAIDYDERDDSVPEGIEVARLRGNDDLDFEFGWMPLSETRREVDGIHRFHRKQYSEANRRLLQEEEASEECLKSELSKYSVIHLATHGYFQPAQLPSAWESVQANDAKETQLGARADLGLEHKLVTGYLPGFLSGLVCAGANAERDPKRDNGLLTAEEVTWIDLSHCDLVVLSACQTALGTTRAGEGMMSLRRAFHQAGAKTVISSLWMVRDDSTRKLMLRFYDNLWNQKLGKLEALRAAQIEVLNQNRKRYGRGLPSTWGAFVLSGEG